MHGGYSLPVFAYLITAGYLHVKILKNKTALVCRKNLEVIEFLSNFQDFNSVIYSNKAYDIKRARRCVPNELVSGVLDNSFAVGFGVGVFRVWVWDEFWGRIVTDSVFSL